MSDIKGEDIERLASRLAMMASEEGEAANAGRAVAQLARRLGLSGGALKEMFLQGALAQTVRPVAPQVGGEAERMEREIRVLRRSVRLLEANYRDLEGERNVLAVQLDTMRQLVATRRGRSRIGLMLIVLLTVAASGGGFVGWLVSAGDLGGARGFVPTPLTQGSFVVSGGDQTAVNPTATTALGPVLRRVGVIKAGRSVARREPDEGAAAVATLLQGTPAVVRRIFGPEGRRWAEIEVGSSIGYIPAADIDLL